MMSESIESQLETLIKARYTLLWLQSHEEERVIIMLSRIAITLNKHLQVWSNTTGLREPKPDGKWASIKDGTDDPLSALDTIEASEKQAIVVFKDMHRFLEGNPMVYRKLRDLHENLKATRKTIIILSPIVSIPVELQKAITVLNIPLPAKDELEPVLKVSIATINGLAETGDNIAKEVCEKITEQLNTNGTKETILGAGLGLTLNEFEDVVMKSIVKTHSLDVGVIISEKEQTIKKSGILEFYQSLASMQDVGGLEILKEWIQKRKLAFSKKAQDFGLRTPKGVFLAGLPGTGKSLISKVSAKHMDMPLLRLDVSKIFASHVGESEQNISNALKLADAVAPCVLWVDEVEKALSGVQSSGSLDSGVTSRIFGTLLTWMQEHESQVFVIATCNNPQAIPPEFMRAGRFDEVFFVDLPSKEEREEIFRIHISKIKRNAEDFKIEYFADITDGFSGAEIEYVVQNALYNAFYDNSDLSNDYINSAIHATTPLSKKRQAELDALRRWGKENAVNASAVAISKSGIGKREVDL